MRTLTRQRAEAAEKELQHLFVTEQTQALRYINESAEIEIEAAARAKDAGTEDQEPVPGSYRGYFVEGEEDTPVSYVHARYAENRRLNGVLYFFMSLTRSVPDPQ